MNAEFKNAGEGKFAELLDANSLFYDIRNRPTPNVEYEDWKSLDRRSIEAWVSKLLEQAKIVRSLIDGAADLKQFRPYHELKAYFYEATQELEIELKSYGFDSNKEEKTDAPKIELN